MFHQILNKYDIISDYVSMKSKSMLLFRPVGLLKYKGSPEEQEVLDHYKKILPQEVYDSIRYDEEAYILFDTFEQAHDKCLEWFPMPNDMPEQYKIYAHIFDVDGTSKFEMGV